MSLDDPCFVEWKEEFISQERGNRVVHYFLKDSAGNSVRAVVGTERSVRHMFYVVDEEFLDVTKGSAHAGFKWRSRREVVDWLTSMLSKQHLSRDPSGSPANDAGHGLGLCNIPMSAHQPNIPDYMGQLARDLKGHDSDIIWSGAAWTCGKQLKHYPAFYRNGTTISIQSFVFVMAKDDDHYLAYLEDMYEDRKRQKKVKVRWFHHNREVKGVISLRNSHPKEVLITPYAQVISAECVDGPATVLTPEHYEKSLAAFPGSSLERVHLCFRQFRSNKVKRFDLSKLRGYFSQPILLCLDANPFCRDQLDDEEEEFGAGENVKPGSKRTRSCRGREKTIRDHSGKRSLFIDHDGPRLWHPPLYTVHQKIELLCQDSGIRGCWFRCTILKVSQKQIKVQYDDVVDEDGCGSLKEWIPAFRLAMPDKLGMRCSRRPTIRPGPHSNQVGDALHVGTPVDTWWSDGWWEGVVVGADDCEGDNVQVYIPGESLFLNVQRKNLRISRDWAGGQWVDVEAKPDILHVLSATISRDTKLSTCSTIAKDARFNCLSSFPCKVSTSAEVSNTIEDTKLDANSIHKDWIIAEHNDVEGNMNSGILANAPDLLEDKEVVNGEKMLLTNDDFLEDKELVNGENQLSTKSELMEEKELVNGELVNGEKQPSMDVGGNVNADLANEGRGQASDGLDDAGATNRTGELKECTAVAQICEAELMEVAG